MKRVYIVHGYGGNPDKNWFPWLKTELEKLDVQVIVPEMRMITDVPEYSVWLGHLQKIVGEPDEETYLIGHSLGCITILQYLNNLEANKKIGGAILVAGFAKPIHFTELNSFFEVPLDDKKIKNSVKKIISINSDNDEHVPMWQAEEIKNRFDTESVIIHNGGHLNHKSGYLEFPLVLEKVKELLKL